MRGEHGNRPKGASHTSGSSPHARGTPMNRGVDHNHSGIIPACAGNTEVHVYRVYEPWDHPRMRGEHWSLSRHLTPFWGSSPHARGTPLPRSMMPCSAGIIPACAGNTRCLVFRGGARWDHPRMRGEHRKAAHWDNQSVGSSPHARGTHIGYDTATMFSGIIPACAGNTIGGYMDGNHQWDHPRMRGEHLCRRFFCVIM